MARKVPHGRHDPFFQEALPARLARAVEVGEVLESELSHGTLSMTSVCPNIHRLHRRGSCKTLARNYNLSQINNNITHIAQYVTYKELN